MKITLKEKKLADGRISLYIEFFKGSTVDEKTGKRVYTGRIPETPEFILKMDHPQTHYFFEQLKIRSTIKLNSLCRIFSYEDGPIKSRVLSASAARAKKNSGGPSNKEIIDSIFIFDR